MAARNPALVVFGNPVLGRFPTTDRSESAAWKSVVDGLEDLLTEIESGQPRAARTHAETLHTLASGMLAQVRRGVHTNPSATMSESSALMNIKALATSMIHGATEGPYARQSIPRRAGQIHELADALLNQVRAGVHTNPRVREPVLSHHVQAIAYVHKKDGDCYVHGFGNAELNALELDEGVLRLSDLKPTTDVRMTARPDGSLCLSGARGQPLSQMFED